MTQNDQKHENFDFRGFDVPELEAVTLAAQDAAAKSAKSSKNSKGPKGAKTRSGGESSQHPKSGKKEKGVKDAKRAKAAKKPKSQPKSENPDMKAARSEKRESAAGVKLFEPMTLRGVTMRNRVWLPPMDMYSAFARDGKPTPFHYQHYVSRAMGGFGMIIVESTAVAPEGRISPCDVGLWEDGQIESWRWIVEGIKVAGAVPAIQLNHAGRKASTGCFAVGYDRENVPAEAGGWPTVAPSPIPFGSLDTPRALGVDEIHGIVTAFAYAAGRAVAAGFQAIELHAAHGYLISQFLDPLCNERDDEYGGDLNGRARFLLEIVDAVRAAIPQDMPLLVRVSATDWAAGGWDLDQTIAVCAMMKRHGVDLVDVSTGGIIDGVTIPVKANYQVPFSEQVREKVGIPVTAVGLITKAKQAEKILRAGDADAIEIGRAALRDPYWPMRAADKLGVRASDMPYPPQYLRGTY
ncbi:NADH:flavin oxidoreductase/NADH oxidase [Bifidobacterium eulemuris]|uniref:NADH-dependent flavin oxidoreductase n=1 Tax=Bifidobacterium eulemuris TaxID=1765219 RepID=A0A261GB00_9BIFI|nr:NADH:flavin oxidoreductase/NADH oxidase [Bifidobacterium eulemuris]OZG68598.1 NADH-dependent flavin oxidoreductase [Bifidobacterium eulemuris]QOL32724.1 NADH:flavin oxidoreductase/NADH oxidase [Bifidobacterium eulemuris]